MTIGSNIKRYRKLKGLTQKELANKVGLSIVTIQKYETGKREPKNIIIKNIADALNISSVDLYKENKDINFEESIKYKNIETISMDTNIDLIAMIKKFREESGITYKDLAKKIGVSKSVLEDIVYGIRPGKDKTRKLIYKYIEENSKENRILNLYRSEEKSYIKRILAINKSIHKLLGTMYIIELMNREDNIIYEVLLEREIV